MPVPDNNHRGLFDYSDFDVLQSGTYFVFGISLFVFDLMSCICCLSAMFDQRAGKSAGSFDAAEGQVQSMLLCECLFRIILETWTSLKSLLFGTCVDIPRPLLRVDIPSPQHRIDIPSSSIRTFILNPSIRIDIPVRCSRLILLACPLQSLLLALAQN